MKYWQKEPNVKSVMIEIRRDLYMNEKTGTKSHNFNEMQKTISKIIKISLPNLNDKYYKM